jgi:hypothetical protein
MAGRCLGEAELRQCYGAAERGDRGRVVPDRVTRLERARLRRGQIGLGPVQVRGDECVLRGTAYAGLGPEREGQEDASEEDDGG